MSRIFAMLLSLTVLSGCMSLPDRDVMLHETYNVPTSGSARLDGKTFIKVSNITCSNSIVLELYQDAANNHSGTVVMKAGSASVIDIDGGKSLQMKIDNKPHSFQSGEEDTEHEKLNFGDSATFLFSYKTYILPEGIVRDAASSKVLLVKLNLSDGKSTAGECSTSTLQHAEKEGRSNADKDQEDQDVDNKFAAVKGFIKFVDLIDLTFGNAQGR